MLTSNFKNTEEILNYIEECWNHGIMKYWNNNNKATYAEFLNEANNYENRNKKWLHAKSVIELGNEKIDDSRNDYFDPFPIDIYTLEDLPENEPFKWIIKDGNIWISLINDKISCSQIVSAVYANMDKKLHVLLSTFNNILFLKYKNNIVKIYKNNVIDNSYFNIKSKLINYLNNNKHFLKVNFAGKGIMEKKKDKYIIYINGSSSEFKNSNNYFEKGSITFRNIIKKNNIKNCEIMINHKFLLYF